MSKIKEVKARQLIDCKCRPMVEVDVITEKGSLGRGSAPTGSSVGMYESFVLRDGDPGEYRDPQELADWKAREPIGVLESERGRQIGKYLLLKTLDAMRSAGYGYAIIGWVGDAEGFYRKTVHAEVIPDSSPENSVYANLVRMP